MYNVQTSFFLFLFAKKKQKKKKNKRFVCPSNGFVVIICSLTVYKISINQKINQIFCFCFVLDRVSVAMKCVITSLIKMFDLTGKVCNHMYKYFCAFWLFCYKQICRLIITDWLSPVCIFFLFQRIHFHFLHHDPFHILM